MKPLRDWMAALAAAALLAWSQFELLAGPQ